MCELKVVKLVIFVSRQLAPYSLALSLKTPGLVNVLYLIQNVLTSDKQTVYHSCAMLKLAPMPFRTASRIYEDDRDGWYIHRVFSRMEG